MNYLLSTNRATLNLTFRAGLFSVCEMSVGFGSSAGVCKKLRHEIKGTCQRRPADSCSLRMTNGQASSMRRRDVLHFGILGSVGLVLCKPEYAKALSRKRILAKAGPDMSLPGGIHYRDVTVGKGNSPRPGDTVAIHYSLYYKDLEVESSRESQGLAARPLGFTYGTPSGPGSILRGVNDGMEGMKVGGLRLMTLPPELAFGDKGKPPLIPACATVEFAVSLLSCKRAGSNPNSIIDPNAQIF